MSNPQSDNEKGIISKHEKFSVEIKYSPEAIEKKLMRFTTPSGDSFEISADEMINMLVTQVNNETLAPVFVDSEKINIVEVIRHIKVRLDEDMKKGTEINLGYKHPYPLEFALIEEAYKFAKIDEKMGMLTLTKEFIDEVKAKIQPRMEEFTKKFHKTYKQLNLEAKEK